MIKNMSQDEEFKITVSLSKKGLAALDSLKETSGFGSRGRTIEEAILTVNEIAEISKPIFSQYTADVQKQGKVSESTQLSALVYFVIIMTKISRFISS